MSSARRVFPMLDLIQRFPYLLALGVISVIVAGLERVAPARPAQPVFRRGLIYDVAHLVFNGHFLGLLVYLLASRYVIPGVEEALATIGLADVFYRGVAGAWPVWVQCVVALFVIDFVQWCVHVMLHRSPWLWEFHKCHHSVEDGEMDWIVSFRFQWTEVIIYKSVQYLPLAWFGFGGEAILFHAVAGTAIGHLNHANVRFDYGPLRYLLNSPKMHMWHHSYALPKGHTVNFGIIFSVWDWLFGTAWLPAEAPDRLGFPGSDAYPRRFLAAESWFLAPVLGSRATPTAMALVSAALLGAAVWLAWRG